MSPEHARHQRVDARADVFAIGIVLWELIAGRRMYRAGEEGSLLDQARRAKIPDLPERHLAEEASLRAIVARALAVDPDARYPTAAAMLRDLDEYAGRAKIMTSALALGDWLSTTFGAEIIARRRARERAVAALEKGAPVVAEPIANAGVGAHGARSPAGPPPQSPVEGRAAVLPAPLAARKDRAGALALVALGVVAIAAVLLALTMR
jgi:serine/threonine-protein kinase